MNIDRRDFSTFALKWFPTLEDATSDEWHFFMDKVTGLDTPLDMPNGQAFDRWRQALKDQGYPAYEYTATDIAGAKARATTPAAAPIEGNDFRWLCNTNAAVGPVYDKNKDGFITGFEQTDWAASVAGSGDVIANAMTFDIDLDRSVTRAEFAAGFKRLAGQINPAGELTFVDLVQPLNRSGEQASASPPPRPPGR